MTERENWFEVYRHGKPEWTPNLFDSYYYVETSAINNKGRGADGKGGVDMYGVNWICTEDTGWQATPDPRKLLFDFEDIANWRDYVQFPDLDSLDWEGAVKRDLANYTDDKVLVLWSCEGNFNRLQSMIGTAECLIAMVEEPEACKDFFDAHTAFINDFNDHIIEYYKPDVFAMGDDISGADNMMMSKDMYNELLKENQIKAGRNVLKHEGMILEHHLCGYAEPLIDDIIETGATIWSTAQSMNDIAAIQKRVGNSLMIDGGWDSTGAHNFAGATEEMVRNEARRCLDSYFNGGFYQCMPVIIGKEDDQGFINRCNWAADELHNYSTELFKKMR